MKNICNLKEITVASVQAPRLDMYSIEKNGEVVYVYDVFLIQLLSQIFHTPLKIVATGEGFGAKRSGKWTGALGLVSRSEADLLIGTLLDFKKFQDFNMSYPFLFSDQTFMTYKPKPISNGSAFSLPFPVTLWVAIFTVIIIFSYVLFQIIHKKQTYENIFFMLLGGLLEKSVNLMFKKVSHRIILSTWLMFSFVITNSYKCVLLSFITLPSLSGITDIEDLSKAAGQNAISCYSYNNMGLSQKFSEMSGVDIWPPIGNCLLKNNITGNAEESFDKYQSNKVFIAGRIYLKSFKQKYFISKDSFFNIMISFPVSRNFSCLSYLNERIHRLFEAGVFQKISEDESLLLALKKQRFDSNANRFNALAYNDIKGTLILLLSGYVLSTIIFVLEILIKSNNYLKNRIKMSFKRKSQTCIEIR